MERADRELIDALLTIPSDLHIRQTLQKIVETARKVTDARYAALGVLSPRGSDHRLSEFVTDGFTQEEIDALAHLPEGKGVLGLIIDRPEPLRLKDLSAHPSSVGFPENHPPMHSFLGVPIRAGGEVFGNLYLTDKTTGDFTVEDEDFVGILARAAGMAITNARIYEAGQSREKRLNAFAEITTAVLSGGDADEVLQIVADRALDLVAADLVLIYLPDREGSFVAEVGAGDVGKMMHTSMARDAVVPVVARTAMTAVIDDLDTSSTDQLLKDVGPALIVPLTTTSRTLGVLFLANRKGGLRFRPDDVSAAEALAGQAAFSLILSEGQRDRGRLLVLEERDRIARDLHDLIIQSIFATGMMLQGVARLSDENSDVHRKVVAAMEQLDSTIREVRSTVTDLRDPSQMQSPNIEARLRHEISAAATLLGFIPHLTFEGDYEAVTAPHLIEQFAAVTREALTNVAKHAHAHSVEVSLVVGIDRTVLSVVDDGVGMSQRNTRRSGLRNLEVRALRLQGHCVVRNRNDQSGVEVRFDIPSEAI
jgi:signal transduction histidine kinase